MVQKVKKASVKADVSVVSKVNYKPNDKFDIDLADEGNHSYISSTTRKERWMYALTPESAKKLTEDQRKICTLIGKKTYVHTDYENVSGRVQYGVLPWSTSGLIGFFNVKASEEQQRKHDAEVNKKDFAEKVAVLKEMLKDGDIDESEFRAAKADLLKESLQFTRK